MESYAARQKRARKDYNKNKKLLLEVLKENKVKNVIVEYDGSGDDGECQGVMINPEEKENVLHEPISGFLDGEPTLFEDLEDLIMNVADFATDDKCPGWENDNGSCVEVMFDVKSQKIKIVQNVRVTEFETYEYEG